MNTKGRVAIPTDMDAVPETLDLLKRWGADAIRDCDGTDYLVPGIMEQIERTGVHSSLVKTTPK